MPTSAWQQMLCFLSGSLCKHFMQMVHLWGKRTNTGLSLFLLFCFNHYMLLTTRQITNVSTSVHMLYSKKLFHKHYYKMRWKFRCCQHLHYVSNTCINIWNEDHELFDKLKILNKGSHHFTAAWIWGCLCVPSQNGCLSVCLQLHNQYSLVSSTLKRKGCHLGIFFFWDVPHSFLWEPSHRGWK